KVDVDNLDQVVERLQPKVMLAMGDEGAVTVPIKSLDDFHPDQLVENLELFEQLLDLRRNLQSKAGFDRAAKEVLSWAGEEALPTARPKARGMAVATDRKLSDFARLVGRKTMAEASADDLIRRLVGPFIQPARDSRQDALVARVDEALSAAMRRVLHHPDFQTAEALWRSVELLVRRIETGAKMQIVLYDISAEELAADLAASDSLEKSGLYSLLVDQPALDAHQGPLSLIAGLYQWELTPPHADLLGRMAQVAGAAGAPFLSGIGPDPLREPQHEWHPLIQQAWSALRGLPASAYLGLGTPRFLLRMPYGKKTDPIDAFAFEEFTRQGGLSGMLWGNPAALVALCLAETWSRDSRTMKLGSVATLDDLPVYVYVDKDGDQIALPCTERLFTEKIAAQVGSLGVIPVVSLRGRPEVRVASFNAVNGQPIAGRWAPVDIAPPPAAPVAAPPPAAPKPAAETPAEAAPAQAAEPAPVATSELDALMASLDETPASPAASAAVAEPAPEPAAEQADQADADLDALLASLNAEPEPPASPDETEADLDALLASLK
ncbi:MAG: type VI secretion system contractile sheath large subunit, partial [Acetobacteraceae bacterium]|nr:type VI secretion system contractile sheath large subunit [Acetobacteraceae bacterium]